MAVIDKVKDEVYGKNSDKLDLWLDEVTNTIIECKGSEGIVGQYKQVLQFLQSPDCQYQQTAILDWADEKVADPWLIGAASHLKSTIVTFENAQSKKDAPWKHPKIPTVAKACGIQCIHLFDFMKKVGHF